LAKHVACSSETRDLVGRAQRMRPRGRPKHSWNVNVNITVYFTEIGYEVRNWTEMVQ
jgi:hypothetical protein